MAARRLIIVLVVLFAISIAAAAVAPERRSPLGLQEESSTTSTTTGPQSGLSPEPGGGELAAEIVGSTENPATVEATVGDQLALAVALEGGGQVEIPPLGLLDTASQNAPARFDILLRDAGTVPITAAGSGEVIGRLLVAEPAEQEAEAGKQETQPKEGGDERPGSG